MVERIGAGNITLEAALHADLLEFWFQPKVNLNQRKVCGVEMFARMRHPLHGTIPARPMLAGASSDSLRKLSLHAIKAARSAMSQLERLGAQFALTVNAPPRLVDSLLLVQALLTQSRPPEAQHRTILLDLQETSVLREPHIVRELSLLVSSSGIKLAVDDFGTQLRTMLRDRDTDDRRLSILKETLATIRGIEMAEIKINAGLVSGCSNNERKAALCGHIVRLIRSIGSTPAAVGLETYADAEQIRLLGCEIGQGHYLGAPMPLNDLIQLFRTRATYLEQGQSSTLGLPWRSLDHRSLR